MSELIHKIKAGKNPPEEIYVVIEIPQGSSIKYEIDEETGELFVDRFLHTAMFYPLNYGFIPQTKEADGDPVDVLVLSDQSDSWKPRTKRESTPNWWRFPRSKSIQPTPISKILATFPRSCRTKLPISLSNTRFWREANGSRLRVGKMPTPPRKR